MKRFLVLLCSIVTAATVFILPTACDLFTAGLGGKVDMDPPTVVITTPTNNAYAKASTVGTVTGISISGTVSDDIGVGSVSISWADQGSSGKTGTAAATVTQNTWTALIPSSGLASADSVYKVTATAVDTSSRKTTYPITVTVDTSEPTGSISTFTDSTTPHGIETTPFNGEETLAGVGSDPGGKLASLTVKIAGVTVATITGAANVTSWSTTVDFNTFLTDTTSGTWAGKDSALYAETSSGSGIYKATIELDITDEAGNVGTITDDCYIDPSYDTPRLIEDYSNYKQTTFGSAEEIKLYFADDDGLNTSTAVFKVISGSGNDGTGTDIGGTISGTTKKTSSAGDILEREFSYTLPSTAAQGSYTLYWYIADKDSKTVPATLSGTRDITLDYGDIPTVNITTPAEASISSSATVALGGNASVSSTSAISTVKIAIDGGTAVDVTKDSASTTTAWAWTYSASGLAEGSHTAVATVTSATSASVGTDTLNFVVDTVAPTCSITTASATWIKSQYLSITCSGSDATSGIDRIEYLVNPGTTPVWDSTQKLVKSSSSWSGNLELVEGPNTVEVRAIDKAGNISAVDTYAVSVDLNKPALSVTSPTDVPRLNGTADLQVIMTAADTAIDSSNPAVSALESVKITKIGSTTLSTPISASITSGNSLSGTWTATIPAATILALTSGNLYEVTATATDNSGWVTTATFNIRSDKDAPTAAISAPTASSTVNKTITVSGTSGDTQALASLVLEVAVDAATEADGWKTLATYTGSGAYNWSTTVDTDAYDGYDADSGTSGTQLSLRATAADEAGNTAAVTRTVTVDQNSDRPIIKLKDLSSLSGSSIVKGTRTITGTISDDDGDTGLVLYASTDSTFTSADIVTVDTGSWSYTAAADGPVVLYFKVTDAAGTSFDTTSTADLTRPLVYEKTGTTSLSSSSAYASFAVDTTDPIVGNNLLVVKTDSTEVSFENNIALGGTNTAFSAKIPAWDANTIASVAITLNGTTVTSSASSGTETESSTTYQVFTVGPFSLSGVTTGVYTATIKVTDMAGLSVTTTRSILVDNTAPTVTVSSPTATELLNGSVTITGTTKDTTSTTNTTSSGLSSLKYQIGKNADISSASSGWTSVGGTSLYSWELAISSIDDYATTTYATNRGDDVWELPVFFRAEDASGNVTITTSTDHVFLVDPNGDKPSVTVVYPSPSATNRKMGGTVRLFGTASDNEAVAKVYVQLAYDSSFSSLINGSSGEAATGTTSWNKTVNLTSYSGTIYFRARAIDTDGDYGPWTDANSIEIDDNVPIFGTFSLTQGTTVRTYEADTYLSGDWTLSGTITDNSSVSTVVVSSQSTSGTGSSSLTLNTGWNGSAGSSRDISIPITTSGTGSITFTISATDNSSPSNTSQYTFTLNYDNTAPTLASYSISSIVQSNYVFNLGSTVSESGSGLKRVAFFFVRSNAVSDSINYNRIYAPLATNGVTASALAYGTSMSAASNGALVLDTSFDPLPRLKLTGATRSSTTSLTHTSLVGNTAVRVGSLIQLSGVDHLVTAVDTSAGTVTWADSEVDESVTTAYFAYAAVVDNSNTETPTWSSGTLTTIKNDDGDGLVEAMTEDTDGEYSWSASIDSTQIPDGPVVLYYVAWDKAGNASTGTVTTKVKNNPLLLASVALGTDLDGSSSISASETTTYSLLDSSSEGQSSATADTATTPFTAKGYTTVAISLLGGNTYSGYPMQYTLAINGTSYRTYTDFSSPIELTLAELQTIGEGSRSLVFNVWDRTEETTVGSDSQKVVLTVPITVDAVDSVYPTAAITPFHWTSESDNSLYGNSRDNGHIELSSVVGTASVPDVSGKISLTGTAYDDKAVASIWMRITNSSAATGMTLTSGLGSGSGTTANYTEVAYYSAGAWHLATATVAADGWAFTASGTPTQSGHTISWQFDFDTSKIDGVVGLNEAVNLIVLDTHPNPVSASYAMDIVPYIRSVTRTSSTTKSSVIRSSLGKYPVQMGETGLTITGFNLKYASGTDYLWVANSESSTPTTSNADVATVTAAAGPATTLTFSLPSGSVTHSGYLRLFESGIEAPNAANTDTLTSNKEDDGNGLSSSSWTDDRYISLWEVGNHFLQQNATDGSYTTTVSYPAMSMDATGALYASWSERSKNRLILANTTGDGSILYKANDEPQYTDINVSTVNSRVTVAYLDDWFSTTYGHLAVATAAAPASSGSSAMGYYGIECEGLDNKLLQFQEPRVVRYTTSSSTAATEVMNICYYDMDTGSVKFSGFLDDATGAISYANDSDGDEKGWVNIDGGSDSDDSLSTAHTYKATANGITVGSLAYSTGDYVTAGSTILTTSASVAVTATVSGIITYSVSAGSSLARNVTVTVATIVTSSVASTGATRSTAAGEYHTIDLDESGWPVIMYYDAASDCLKLAYTSSRLPKTTMAAAGWTRQVVFSSGSYATKFGKFVSMKFDSAGNLHAAAYSELNSGTLVYLYAPASASSYTFTATVIETGIDVQGIDIAIDDSNHPYISYRDANKGDTLKGLKYAWYNGSSWEAMTVPVSTAVGDSNTGIEVKKTTGGTWAATWGQTAIAYLSTTYDLAYRKGEE